MSKKLVFGITAVAALLVAALYAAVPPAFIPDSTFQGSSLTGWHVLGQADWRAENGELIGKPRNEAGGWLVLDKSYQDIGFFASFRCTGACKTGVLFRMEKIERGLKGTYVSLTKGDMGSYTVTLDEQGREMTRERLRPATGQIRYSSQASPSQAPPAGRGGRGGMGRAPVFDPEQWNTIQAILDSDLLRPTLGLANASAGRMGGGGRGMISGGATDDNMNGYGPVALYVGGSGEVRFKDVAFKDLVRKIEPVEKVSDNFQMQRISDFYYAWCADVADINHDGVPDIVAPPFYYTGPNFTERYEFMAGRTINVSTEYTDHMVVFAYDFTGDGWPDIITTPTNGKPLYLYVNPRGQSRRWESRIVVPSVGTEIALFKDIDGDGKPDFLYASRDNGIEFAAPDWANPNGPWKVTSVSGPQENFNPHGLGVGDINGDGRMDVLSPLGWFEQPAKGSGQPWKLHPANLGGGSAEMSVYDVNGDGLNDVVTPLSAHQYGISWFEQKRDAQGNISFVEHPIMTAPGGKSVGDIMFSEPHASIATDLDGDGIPDFIVGKRLFSHREGYSDPDPYGPSVLYWYRTVRNPNAPGGAEFVPELIHNRSGVGSHFVAVDVNHDGMPDIITSADKGTFIFYNKMKKK
jgi:hypothetical protein